MVDVARRKAEEGVAAGDCGKIVVERMGVENLRYPDGHFDTGTPPSPSLSPREGSIEPFLALHLLARTPHAYIAVNECIIYLPRPCAILISSLCADSP